MCHLAFLYNTDICKQRIMSPMCPGSIWCQCESSVLTLKNDLSQQDLERRGCCVWQSPALCWQPNRVAEEGIIRIVHTHTRIQIHTSTCKYSCTEYLHTLHQTWKTVCTLACTEKKERKHLLTDIFYLKQSMTLWPLSCRTMAERVKAKRHQNRQGKPIIWHATS